MSFSLAALIRRLRASQGAAVVELALALPLLLFLFVVSVDFARVYYSAQIVSDCARTGALYAANPDLGDKSYAETMEQQILANTTDLSPPPTVTVVYGKDTLGNDYVDVTVSYQFKVIMSYVGIPPYIDITRSSRARLYANLETP
jgi:Flp pilus assembly protein TadG